MSLDMTTLGLVKRRDRYEKLARSIPPRALDPMTAIVLSDFGRFFKAFPDAQTIDPDAFRIFFAQLHSSLPDEKHAIFAELFKRIHNEEVPPELEAGLVERLVAAASAVDLADLIAKHAAGEEVDLRTGTQEILDKYDQQVDRKVKNPQVLDPIEDLLKEEANDTGLHWRLGCLNRHIKPLRGGDFVIVAARPDKGKTTFITAESTMWASQVDTIYPGEGRCVMHLNNEGPGKKIVTRCFQSALNATVETLVEKSNAGTIRQEYKAALGGRGGTLRVFDIHEMNNVEVEDLIRMHKPAVVIFDMIDNINFLGGTNNNGQRTDQLLESMYQWARMLAVKYDFAAVASSQISADGDGERWPTLPMLKDSKTGKQGAADLIITIGTINDPAMVDYRYIGVTKSKKARTGVSKNPMASVWFDGDRGRYVEEMP